ncbi:MAG: CoA-binding protein [Elusimicrobia bacterium]|nr:CoA-binding protein [Elusimicrobiota bacterium]
MATVAVVGASKDRGKYGCKAVRAYLQKGYEVFPVNPRETDIEGLKVYRSVLDIPTELDRVTVYLPPVAGLKVIEEIARKGTKELYLNPGSESQELIDKARSLGLNPILACSIVEIGVSPQSV